MSAALVTLSEAKLHLHLETTTAHDADIMATLEAASATIVNYLDVQADETWTPETVPRDVKSAVLLEVGYLFKNRGDDPASYMAHVEGRKHLLARRRDQVFA